MIKIPVSLKKRMNALEIQKSNLPHKKYMTYVNNKKIHFGSSTNDQYKDSTELKLYSDKDHNDIQRRELFYKRHSKNILKSIEDNVITASLLSAYFLW